MNPVNFHAIRRVFRDGRWHCRYQLRLKLGEDEHLSPGIRDLWNAGELRRSNKKRKHPVQNRMVWYYRAK